MTNIRIAPKTDLDATSIDLATVDVDRAMQRGRQLRSEAFTSALKSLFRNRQDAPTGHRDERTGSRDGFSPDCAAPA